MLPSYCLDKTCLVDVGVLESTQSGENGTDIIALAERDKVFNFTVLCKSVDIGKTAAALKAGQRGPAQIPFDMVLNR